MSRETPDRSPMVKYPVLIFVCNGYWCPMWFSPTKKLFYRCYTILSLFFITSFGLAQFIDTLVTADSITDSVNNSITFMPTINALCKALNLLANRQTIIRLMYNLDNEIFYGRNSREMKILEKYKRLSRFISGIITVNTLVTLEFMVFGPIIKNTQLRKLPFGAWIPYGIDTEVSFWFSLMWEKIASSAVGLANLGNDLLSISIMMHLSGQLDILSDRFINMADDDSDISKEHFDDMYSHEDFDREKRIRDKFVDCLHHHILIFQLADELQSCFVWTFAVQMLVSLTGTCAGTFQLARFSIGDSEFTTAALFVGCMISEAFLYCWFGNEVHLKSLEIRTSVYKMNWISLRVDLQKDILNVCMRAKRPILFTTGPAMPLSNEFFVNILQASYTAFTVLREISVDLPTSSMSQIQNADSVSQT